MQKKNEQLNLKKNKNKKYYGSLFDLKKSANSQYSHLFQNSYGMIIEMIKLLDILSKF